MGTLPVAMAIPVLALGAESDPVRSWGVEIGGGLLVFDPNVTNIPRGSSDTVIDPQFEVSVGRSLSSRLMLRLSAAYADGTESAWESRSGGHADIPTPSITSVIVGLESSLLVGRVIPVAGIGGGFTHFSRIDEEIRFEWPSSTESNRFHLDAQTDPTLLFDLGLVVPAGPTLSAVVRYRLLSVFDGDEVDTLDQVTLTGRFGF